MTDNIIERFFEGIITDEEELRILKLLFLDLTDDEILSKLLEREEK